MNNKMAINTYLSTTESKRQTKQRRIETESWIQRVLMVARWDGVCGGMGEEVRGLRSNR